MKNKSKNYEDGKIKRRGKKNGLEIWREENMSEIRKYGGEKEDI